MSSASCSTSSLLPLPETWHLNKLSAPLPKRLAMSLFELILVAAAMFIVPTILHKGVQSFDDLNELLGRRAGSPYSSGLWSSVVIAVGLLVVWHVCLGRLSYKMVFEDRTGRKDEKAASRGFSWGLVLGRIIIPLLILVLGVHFGFQVLSALAFSRPLIVPSQGLH